MIWLIILVLFVIYLWKRNEPKNLPPGPRGLPVIGNMHQIDFARMQESFDQWKHEYGDITHVKLLRRRMIVLNTFDTMKEAFVKHGDNFSARPTLDFIHVFTEGRNGYVNTDGWRWKEQRRHALHILRDFGLGRTFQEDKIEIEIEDLFTEFDKSLAEGHGVVNPILPIKYAVVNIINNMLYGFRYKYDDSLFDKLQRLLQENFMELMKIIPFEFLPGMSVFCRILPVLFPKIGENLQVFRDVFKDLFEQHWSTHEQDLENNNGKSSDFLYAYITEMKNRKDDPENTFTEKQIFYAINDLFVAGFETTATTLSWFLIYMAHYPDIQEKMRQEILGSSEGNPSYGDRAKYPYTTAVVAEVQRCGNILPLGVFHTCFKDDVIAGYTVPAGSLVTSNIWSIMRDPKLFPDFLKFNPDRFLDGAGQGVNNVETVIPFSIGKRSCLGEGLARMELFMFTTAIVSHYKIEMPPASEPQQPKLDDAIMTFTRAPLPYKLRMTRIDG